MEELKKILEDVQQERQPQSDKSSKDKYDPTELRTLFLQVFNKNILESSGGKSGLIMDKEIQIAIELVCQYINREKAFTVHGFDFNKGLWICGNFGSGKTQLILTYKEVMNRLNGTKIGFQSCTDMNMRFLKKDELTNKIASHDGLKNFANKFDKMERIFDDLGEEETTVLEYGNRVCVMANILSERYKGIRNGTLTHITTNLTTKQIAEIYGGRIESRIAEMFNIIKLGTSIDSPDYRKI